MINNIWSKTHNEREVDLLRPWYSPALSLLASLRPYKNTIIEIGCGNGELASMVIQNYPECFYLGLDGFLLSAIEAKQTKLDVALAEFEHHLPLSSSIADIVITLEVIEHIARAEDFISEINRILKPDGYLILSTPNVGYFNFRLKYLIHAEVPGEGVHLRFFNRYLLQGLLRDAEFVIIKKKSITPIIGYNRLMRIFWNKNPRFVTVSDWIEGLIALDLIWLLKKI